MSCNFYMRILHVVIYDVFQYLITYLQVFFHAYFYAQTDTQISCAIKTNETCSLDFFNRWIKYSQLK